MTPEGKVKAAVKRILDRYDPVWYFMPVQSGYGKQGIPDYVICANGFFIVVECKAGTNRLSSLQTATRRTIEDAYGTWLTINEDNLLALELLLIKLRCTPNETA